MFFESYSSLGAMTDHFLLFPIRFTLRHLYGSSDAQTTAAGRALFLPFPPRRFSRPPPVATADRSL